MRSERLTFKLSKLLKISNVHIHVVGQMGGGGGDNVYNNNAYKYLCHFIGHVTIDNPDYFLKNAMTGS